MRNHLTSEIFLFSYPSSMIEKEFQKFFHDQISSSLPFLPFLRDATEFLVMRKGLIGQSTPTQSQVVNDIANAILHNDQLEELASSKTTIVTKKPESKKSIDENTMLLHYTHEKRFASTKRDIHKTYADVFTNTPAMNIRMIVGNRNRRAAATDLIRKKPIKSLLRNTLTEVSRFSDQI